MADAWPSEWEAELQRITTKKLLIAIDIQPILLESDMRPAIALRSSKLSEDGNHGRPSWNGPL
jgi:hypothetical protein